MSDLVWETFHVPALDCPSELAVAEQAVATLPGVHRLEPDYLARSLRTQFDPGRIDSESIAAALTNVGLAARVGLPLPTVTANASVPRLPLKIAAGGALLLLAAITYWGSIGPEWLASVLAVMAAICAGQDVARAAWRAVRARVLDMNVLMTIAAVGAVLIGDFFEAATAMVLFGVALWLESLSMARAQSAVTSLIAITPSQAHRLERAGTPDQTIVDIAADAIAVGDLLLVRPGERIPADGTVFQGGSAVDQSSITGESVPVDKQAGDRVYAGTLNGEGSLTVQAAQLASNSTLAQVARIVEQARASRSPTERFVDRFARRYTPAVILLASAIVIVPLLASWLGYSWATNHSAVNWIHRGLVLLVIACPCALVISTPVTVVSGLYQAARRGMLIKGGEHLENAAKVDAVAFDKTGTLTTGELTVVEVVPLNSASEERVLAVAATLERASEHPLARAIVRAGQERKVNSATVQNFLSERGRGAKGQIDGQQYYVGSDRYMRELQLAENTVDANDANSVATTSDAGSELTEVWVATATQLIGKIRLADRLRPHAREAVAQLRSAGIRQIHLLTGDRRRAAERVAAELGIDSVHAELLPQDKIALIQQLAPQCNKLAMVGDGVNDGPALAAAGLGIALGSQSSDLAMETANVVLVNPDLIQVPELIRLGKTCRRLLYQNIGLALVTKLAILGLAAVGMATMWMAVAADVGASLIVIFNGMRILRPTLRPSPQAAQRSSESASIS